ncbi:MAG: hypothetical protein Q8M56_06790, partial [Desulfobacterales bacterium]|nr:hypothetical protein [Desulfobacterales bacterium]
MEDVQVVVIKEVEKKLAEMKIKDIEISGGRELKGVLKNAFFVVSLAMSLFHIIVLTVYAIDPWYFRTMHVVFAGVLIFAWLPGWKKASLERIEWLDYLFMLLIIAPAVYIFSDFDDWINRVGVVPTDLDFIFSTLFVISIFEMTRRTTGLPLAILSGIFILYGLFGNYMPGLFYHRGYSLYRLITFLFSLEGILSLPILASAHYIFLFVLFGAFVE